MGHKKDITSKKYCEVIISIITFYIEEKLRSQNKQKKS